MHKHRILVLIKGLGIGGAEKLISEGARFWDRDQFDYRVAYLLPWKNQLVPELEEMGVEVHQLGSGSMLSAIPPLRRLVKEWKPDLVHAHLPSTGILARVASSVPVVYTEHNLANSYRGPTRSLNRLTYARNAAVIAVSEQVAGSLAGFAGPEPHVVPNGVSVRIDEALVSSVRSELRLEANHRLVVHVGNIRPHKGHEMLIEVARLLAQAKPHARVVSIGAEKNQGDLARLDGLVASAGNPPIQFLGRIPNAVDFIAAAEVFVNPADVEGLPVAMLEAMSAGTPMAVTGVGGVPSVVSHMENGLLVPPGDPRALAGAITTLLDDRDLAQRLATAARESVEAKFGLDRMVDEVESVYRDILE